MPTKVTYIHVELLITDFIQNIPKTYLQQRRIFIMEQKMFCYQCEQTVGCTACTGAAGVCGKKAGTAKLQDELTGALIGLARAVDGNEDLVTEKTDALMIESLFMTLTNVNFDDSRIQA